MLSEIATSLLGESAYTNIDGHERETERGRERERKKESEGQRHIQLEREIDRKIE